MQYNSQCFVSLAKSWENEEDLFSLWFQSFSPLSVSSIAFVPIMRQKHHNRVYVLGQSVLLMVGRRWSETARLPLPFTSTVVGLRAISTTLSHMPVSGNVITDTPRGVLYWSPRCVSIQSNWQSRLTIIPSKSCLFWFSWPLYHSLFPDRTLLGIRVFKEEGRRISVIFRFYDLLWGRGVLVSVNC
jgi:hypothetical protein